MATNKDESPPVEIAPMGSFGEGTSRESLLSAPLADCKHIDTPQIRLACPECGGSTLVSWERLAGHFFCRRCNCWYRVGNRGLVSCVAPENIRVEVRSSFSGWHSSQVNLGSSQKEIETTAANPVTLRRRKLTLMRRTAVGVVLLLAGVGLLWKVFSKPAAVVAQAAELPTSLEGRADAFVAAWLQADTETMLKLVPTAEDRTLRRWVARNAPPSAATAEKATILISVGQADASSQFTTVKVRVKVAEGSDPVEQDQRWVHHQAEWYFLPPAR